LPTSTECHSTDSELSVAIDAARAASEAATRAREAGLEQQTKGVSADVVTNADRAAEAAAVAILQQRRPHDGLLGEEGSSRTGARRWVIDGVDGTVNFANRIAGGWCSAVALEDDHGPLAAAVVDPTVNEIHAAARGAGATLNGEPTRVRPAKPLAEAFVATFLRQDRLVKPGVRDIGHRLLDRAGLIRHAGPGSLELAWVAAGRLDAWIQPEVDPWDWLPGSLLVVEAGGEARVIQREVRWHIAGPAGLVEELAALLA
jgi:myo-inositol-1(or 4)-monophosphatase